MSENYVDRRLCNCRIKDNGPQDSQCQVRAVVYKATVMTTNDEKDRLHVADGADL